MYQAPYKRRDVWLCPMNLDGLSLGESERGINLFPGFPLRKNYTIQVSPPVKVSGYILRSRHKSPECSYFCHIILSLFSFSFSPFKKSPIKLPLLPIPSILHFLSLHLYLFSQVICSRTLLHVSAQFLTYLDYCAGYFIDIQEIIGYENIL